MVMGSQRLADDYEQLKDLLALYPQIAIVKTDGHPPDTYEILYSLRGYVQDDADTIVIGASHRICISLPFGYPHFAPIAKPLTPIFHPDFDPAAIGIAEQWQQNPSLPELVLHIGAMISGNTYNLDDPFNQEAADWYQLHAQQLPLDALSVADNKEVASELAPQIDDSLVSLSLKSSTFLEPEKPVDASEIAEIRSLITQNKIFTANERLANIPESADFPDREELQQNIGVVFRKIDRLFKLYEQFEGLGNLDKAIKVLDNLQGIAADAPGIDALRTRIHKFFPLAHADSAPQQKKEEHIANKFEEETKTPSSLAQSIARTSFSRMHLPYNLFLALLLVLGGSIGALFLYFRDQTILSQSQANLQKSKVLMNNKQFDSALETLKATQIALTDLTILRFRKYPLEQELNLLTASTDLQEGLKGRVLYQGEYILAEKAALLAELEVLTDQALVLDRQNKIEETLNKYRQALNFASKHGLNKQQSALQEKTESLELRHTLLLAQNAEQEKKWDVAAEAYRKALKISGNIDDLGTTGDITHRLTAATFHREMDQSEKAFTQSQWQETIEFLERSQQALNANPSIATEKERQDLHRRLVNSHLYLMLSKAREASLQNNWPMAIKEYQNALTLLANESDTMENTLNESVAKIEKTLLMANIAQIQAQVVIAEGEEKLAAVVAHCKEIQQLIRSSKYATDPAVQTVSQKVSDRLEKYQERIELNEKTAWLEAHYEEIFRTHYPSFQGSKLLQPKAVFLKKINKNPVFTIKCVERSQGNSSKLELNYMFDMGAGKWSVYNEQ